MSEAGSLLWTGEQHAWLRALGHTVWVPGQLAAAEAPALDAPAAPVRRPPAREAVPPPASSAPPRRPPPAAATDSAPAAPRRAPPRGSLLPDRLRIELLRASGLNPNTPEAAAIMAAWPDSASLRGNAAAKRALWPQLRALRRKRLP
ncbi:alanine acetyltransferase [Pseudoxanthomonas winnipegensis]|uniref:Alanine acetyltransferase n=1 Tax=Pseudoxanthomonas winnipegensis TaxID=2480810 RepID=A0A4Q8LUX5_9GAMM|nr:alanine acetyltransferase [Pseudoxanthomonas winnipegensis]RZZ82982.1 alanine acetyltransferase [Pseudoxanthomonas winnipegensis]TAA35324.1 alanine acetyltransferase [Pseudoxanthomonas winnipegensis]